MPNDRLLLLALATLLTTSGFGKPTCPEPPPGRPVAESQDLEKLTPEAIREDLRQLYSTLKKAHFNLFARRSQVEYDRYFAELRSGLRKPVTRLEAAKLLQRFTAFGRVAHANLFAPFELAIQARGMGARWLPLYVRIEKGRFFLSEHADEAGQLCSGSELISIAGKPMEYWSTRLGSLISADHDYLREAQMERLFPALVWLELGEVAEAEVMVKDAKGQTITAQVTALTRAGVTDLHQKRPTPKLAVDFGQRELRLLGAGMAYLRPGPFYNTKVKEGDTGLSYEDSDYRTFLDGAFRDILAAKTTELIVDLRDNPGGDNGFSDPMVAWFADRPFRFTHQFVLKASAASKDHYAQLRASGAKDEGVLGLLMRAEAAHKNGDHYPFVIPMVEPRSVRFTGRVFVLQNRRSFSNAASVAALIQDYGFGTILGEETADLPSTYGSSVPFKLKHTGFNVSYPKSRITRISGDIHARGVIPDIPLLPQPIGVSEDRVLGQTVALIQQSRMAPQPAPSGEQ